MGAAPEVEDCQRHGEVKERRSGEGGDGERKGQKEGEVPMYTLQALWDGKMKLKDFEVTDDAQKPTLPHNVYEQDEALPVIDVAALAGQDQVARAQNLNQMLEAAKSWGFFKIRNHGVPLQVVHHHHLLIALDPSITPQNLTSTSLVL